MGGPIPVDAIGGTRVTVKEKISVTQHIHGSCPTHWRTEISVRDVKAVIDEPKEREGTNMGPTPTETNAVGGD